MSEPWRENKRSGLKYNDTDREYIEYLLPCFQIEHCPHLQKPPCDGAPPSAAPHQGLQENNVQLEHLSLIKLIPKNDPSDNYLTHCYCTSEHVVLDAHASQMPIVLGS